MIKLTRGLGLLTAALVVATPLGVTVARATSTPTPVNAAGVFLWPRSGAPAAALAAEQARTVAVDKALGLPNGLVGPNSWNDLIYHGGVVQTDPKIYVIFWGRRWKTGFATGDKYGRWTNRQAMTYITDFYANLGGSKLLGVASQYCEGAQIGTVHCARGDINTQHNVLAGVWLDASAVPSEIVTTGLAENITHDPLATEAVRAAGHFGHAGNLNATYMIFTPTGVQATAYGSVYCAYHSEVTNVGGHGIRYGFIPYLPDQGAGCGQFSVNARPDRFGHGWFDAFSLAGGHEFIEAMTDPDAWPFQDGWNDYSTSEIGDKCAYFDTKNVTLGRYYFAVQPEWSNMANAGAGGCAYHLGSGPAPAPPITPV
jgi:hypothetical protein